jgi:hypothetical protein
MVGSLPGCCARAPSGHVAAVAKSVMNSRLFIDCLEGRRRYPTISLRLGGVVVYYKQSWFAGLPLRVMAGT